MDAERGTHRAEGFSDAFFAIVITLLVLDLRIPEAMNEMPLHLALADLWTVALAYVISFVNIYILWVSHHELVRITTRADTGFLYLNGALLFGIALMPFSTALLADNLGNANAPTAAAIFTGVLLWVSLCFNFLWRYVALHPDRLLPSVTPRDRRRISATHLITLGLYAIGFVLSWFLPIVGIALMLALAVFFAVADRISGFASEDIAND